MLITTDFETCWDDLYCMGDNKLTTLEYVTDRRFKAHMLGVKYDDNPTFIVPGEDIQQLVDEWRKLQATGTHVALLAHNTQFDGLILYHHYGFVADFYYDTKAMSSGLWHHQSSSLRALAERLWPDNPAMRKGHELESSKGIRDLPPALYDSLAGYCAMDVNLCYAALQKMLGSFPECELETINIVTGMCVDPRLELDFDLIERYIPFLENRRKEIIAGSGLHVFAEIYNPDKKGRPQFVKEWETEVRKGRQHEQDRQYWLALKVLNSNTAFSEWLRTNNIQVPKKQNEKGELIPALSQQDFAYQQMAARYNHFRPVWESRKTAKSNINLTRAIRYRDTAKAFCGKLPLPVTYSAAHTHRLGGAQKLNAQNMTRNAKDDHPDGDLRPGALRRALLAPADQFVYVADSSNIELRLSALLSDNVRLLNLFRDGGDPYIETAQEIYKCPLNKEENRTERGVGKATELGCSYGMGVARFKDYLNTGPLGMPPIFFKDESMYAYVVQTYRRINYSQVDFWARCDYWLAEMAKPDCNIDYKMLRIRYRKIILPSGLALEYPNLRLDNNRWVFDSKEDGNATSIWGGSMTENIMQALATEFIKDRMRAIDRYFRTIGGKVVLQVHDEIIAVGTRNNADAHMATMLDLMRQVPAWAADLPVDAEGDYDVRYSK